MADILHIAKTVFDFLDGRGVRAALVGGLAVSARTEPRFTRDIDIAVLVPDDDAAEALLRALRGIGFVAADVIEQQAAGRLATARCVRPSDPGGVVVDLLFASSGIEEEIVREAATLELAAGIRAPVASAACLLATKVLSRSADRPQDEVDIAALLAEVDPSELAHVAELLQLIETRGYSRGKALQEELESLSGFKAG